jgi:hypothetical protein
LLCAIPYTGWLVGYFVSARMLWRVPWMLPIGLITFSLLKELFKKVQHYLPSGLADGFISTQKLNLSIVAICLLLVFYYSELVYQYQGQSTKTQLDGYRNQLSQLSELGNYLESHIERPSRFIAPSELMNYLPGISSKSKVVVFRVREWTPYPVDTNEIGIIFSNSSAVSAQERMHALAKYKIQYILVDQPLLEKYYASLPQFFELQYTGRYWLFKVLANY